MNTVIIVQNIPEEIKCNIHHEYTIEGNFKVNIGDHIKINDHPIKHYKQLGNNIDFSFIVKDIIHKLVGTYEDFGYMRSSSPISQSTYCKTIFVELEHNTIKEIENIIRIDEHISTKDINFE